MTVEGYIEVKQYRKNNDAVVKWSWRNSLVFVNGSINGKGWQRGKPRLRTCISPSSNRVKAGVGVATNEEEFYGTITVSIQAPLN